MSNLVLVVDDSPTMVMSLVTQLTEAGFATETAMDGRQALERLQGGLRPDLILTDINMPVMDGISLVREIRRFRPVRFVPILILTTETGREAEARGAGASGWLVKPVAPEALIAAIERLLPEHGMPRKRDAPEG